LPEYVLYVERKSFFHSLDPRSKLLFVISVFVWSSVFNHPLYTGVVLASVLAIVFASGVASRLKLFWFGLLSLAVMSLVLWPLFRRGGTTPLFEVMGFTVTQESLMYALAVAFRLVAMVLSGLLLLTTTRIEELELAFTKLGLPFPVAFGFSAVFRFIPTMVGDGLTVLAAQQCRGVNLAAGQPLQEAQELGVDHRPPLHHHDEEVQRVTDGDRVEGLRSHGEEDLPAGAEVQEEGRGVLCGCADARGAQHLPATDRIRYGLPRGDMR